MNSERLIGISDAFSAFVYGYPSSCPRAHCTPNKSMTTLRYTRRHGPVYYTGHACRHLPSAVPWISEDCLFLHCQYYFFKFKSLNKNLTLRFSASIWVIEPKSIHWILDLGHKPVPVVVSLSLFSNKFQPDKWK